MELSSLCPIVQDRTSTRNVQNRYRYSTYVHDSHPDLSKTRRKPSPAVAAKHVITLRSQYLGESYAEPGDQIVIVAARFDN